MKYNNLPVFEAKISSENDGIIAISLVDYPAVESEFVCFNKEEKPQKFSIDSEEERIITGVVMLADTPIYRVGPSGYEYYITFNRETIKQMAAKMLADGTFKYNDIQHDGEMIEGLELLELYIKDEKKGITPNFVDVPDGSLLASYHVTNDTLWEEVKNGNFLNGFSLEGFFQTVETEMNNNKQTKTKMSIIEKLMKSLVKFSEVATDKGVLLIQDGDEFAVGVNVYVENEGEWIEAPAGEYTLEDGRIAVVENGAVAEIRDNKEPEEEEAPAAEEEIIVAEEEEAPAVEEEVVVPTEDVRDAYQEQIDALKDEIAALKADIEALRGTITEIVQKPAVEPIEEEFSKVKENDTKGVTGGQKKALKLFSSISK